MTSSLTAEAVFRRRKVTGYRPTQTAHAYAYSAPPDKATKATLADKMCPAGRFWTSLSRPAPDSSGSKEALQLWGAADESTLPRGCDRRRGRRRFRSLPFDEIWVDRRGAGRALRPDGRLVLACRRRISCAQRQSQYGAPSGLHDRPP